MSNINTIAALFLATALRSAFATCANDCSGNGFCNQYSACECYRNWMGNDCSKRVCYFDLAFVDSATGDLNSNGEFEVGDVRSLFHNQPTHELFSTSYGLGKTPGSASWSEAHFPAECSGKGTCERESGQCACFEGYEGEGCTRVACPSANDKSCSGHGICQRLVDLDSAYKGWDTKKTQRCVCDPGFTGIMCDQRVCPSGDDPVTKVLKRTRICFGDDAALTPGTGNSATYANMEVYGTVSNAKATFVLHNDGSVFKDDTLQGVTYESCFILINEEGLFVENEDVVFADGAQFFDDETVQDIIRDYAGDSDVQNNEEQQIYVETTADFALVYTDELGAVYTTRTIACASTIVDCAADVEAALEELPHDVVKDIDVTGLLTATCEYDSGSHTVTGIETDLSITCVDTTGASFYLYNAGTAVCVDENAGTYTTTADANSVDCAANCVNTCTFYEANLGLNVEFIENSGDEEPIVVVGSGSVTVIEVSKGTTENVICSNRGICDFSTGICKCFQGFTGGDCSRQNVLAMY